MYWYDQEPIIVVDDDLDDREIYSESIRAIGVPNEIRFFENGPGALDYLYTTPNSHLLFFPTSTCT